VELTTIWFSLIAVLFIGYFVLEGFDFGVGMLAGPLSDDDTDRRVVINTIGPVWDGNEVWLITAGGALFAAFPEWYATLFSGFYLPLLAILVALIVRGVAFEYRGKVDTPAWRRGWDRAIFWSSVVPSFLWGVAFANILRGVPLDQDHEWAGSLLDLLSPYALLGGLVTLSLFLLHGAVFVSLKTDGQVRHRARALARRLAPGTVVVAATFLLWTHGLTGNLRSAVVAVLAALCLVTATLLVRTRREGWAFTATAFTIAFAVASLFLALFPDVLPSTVTGNSLTVDNAASTDYTLTVMTWVAAFGTPVVVGYQAWTYWVFRKRISRVHIAPVAALVPTQPGPLDDAAGVR
jgi:cytochrome bd ubiquinol oxidase subunit II